MATVVPFPADVAMPDSETGESIREIAEAKARGCSAALGNDALVIASDGGLLVPALGSRWDPTRTRRFAGSSATDLERAFLLLAIAGELRGAQRRIGWTESVALARGGHVVASMQADGPAGMLTRRVDPELIAAGDGFWVQALWRAPEFGDRVLAAVPAAERASRRDYWDELGERTREYFREDPVVEAQLSTIWLDPRFGRTRSLDVNGLVVPDNLEQRVDYDTLAYDLFWEADRVTARLMGPPKPEGMDFVLTTLPGGEQVHWAVERSTRDVLSLRSVVPPGTTAVELRAGQKRRVCAIQPNAEELFAGKRVLITMSQNNPLQWIVDWVRFHVHHHGVNAVLLYDNRSTTYSAEDIEAALAVVPGLERIVVIRWPFRLLATLHKKAKGGKVGYWTHGAALNHAYQRFLRTAAWVIQIDLDELVIPRSGISIDAAVRQSGSTTIIVMERQKAYAATEASFPPEHRKFTHIGESERLPKYVFVPTRMPVDAEIDIHRIYGIKPESRLIGETGFTVLHLRALTNGWEQREERLQEFTNPAAVFDPHVDEMLAAALENGPVAPAPWSALASGQPDLIRRTALDLLAQGDHAGALQHAEWLVEHMPDDQRHARLIDEINAAKH